MSLPLLAQTTATATQLAELRARSDQAAGRERYADALVHRRAALEISRHLDVADELLPDLLACARYTHYTGNRGLAAELARETLALAEPLQRHTELEEAWLLLALIYQVSGDRETATRCYEHIHALPTPDHFRAYAQQAAGYNHDNPRHHPFLTTIWQDALHVAETTERPDQQVQAHQKLGELALAQQQHEQARQHFDAAAHLTDTRTAAQWQALARLQLDTGQLDEARQSFQAGITQATADADLRITLLAELAALEARRDQPAQAYAHLRTAYDERVAIGRNQQTIKATSLPPAQLATELDAIAELSAVRHALQAAELERTRLRQRQTLGFALVAALLAALLALAYAYKRRAAAHARLAAEHAQLEALRYQLNPHFLFNALANLNGLILSRPDFARQTVRRLSDFCRLALSPPASSFPTVGEEAQRLSAYLDVARAAAEDDLTITFTVDPDTHPQAIPPLLIQPLLENALKYAEPDDTGQRRVTAIIALKATDNIRIEISNTGNWIEPTASSPRPGSGVGLANLRARLDRHYPQSHHLHTATDADGVTQTLTLTGPPRRSA